MMSKMDWKVDPKLFREKVREGIWKDSTVSICPGYVQANLVILPREFAFDFTLFCLRNPQPCPILEILEAGNPMVCEMAKDADIRVDLPQYRIFENGEMVREVDEIRAYWRDDLVTFLIGCSYTFEEALVRGGVPVRNYLQGKDPGVYVSSIQCKSAGIFLGPMVVTMRPIPSHLVSRAVQITSRFPKTHGAPVHVGDGAAIGISDYRKIDFGCVPEMVDGEIPVFWGCGVTPQMVALQSKVPFVITHKPTNMFVTDVRIEEIAYA
jgi:uncharacterized protein YcsI (UPF0317 family)